MMDLIKGLNVTLFPIVSINDCFIASFRGSQQYLCGHCPMSAKYRYTTDIDQLHSGLQLTRTQQKSTRPLKFSLVCETVLIVSVRIVVGFVHVTCRTFKKAEKCFYLSRNVIRVLFLHLV